MAAPAAAPTDAGSEPPHTVVRNDEDQYSIWASDRPLPDGWYDAGFTGSVQACLAHVDEVWTDMRPRRQRGA